MDAYRNENPEKMNAYYSAKARPVERKHIRNCNFLLNVNMRAYKEYDRHEVEAIDTINCWHIALKHDAKHPAVFPVRDKKKNERRQFLS